MSDAKLSTGNNDLVEIDIFCKNRQVIYSFLSRMFEKEMSEDLILELQERAGSFTRMKALKELGNSKLNRGLTLLEDYLKESTKRDMKNVLTELAVEYAGLFLSVWGTPAHPSESAYASGGMATMQKERDEVLAMYRAEGVDKVSEFTEPEDHVALELQFMSYLAGETSRAASSGNMSETIRRLAAQQSFLKNHLGKWIGLLANDVLKQGKVGFYKGVCLIAEGLVEEDTKALIDIVSETRPHYPAAA